MSTTPLHHHAAVRVVQIMACVIGVLMGSGSALALADEHHDRDQRHGLYDVAGEKNDGDDCVVEYLTDDLTGNRYNGIPGGRLQVVAYYDGAPVSPELHIDLTDGTRIVVGSDAAGGPIEPFGVSIATREYHLAGCSPTGRFRVVGAEPNGVVDGLAFGVLWVDESGHYSLGKSVSPPESEMAGANFVGMWPLGFSPALFGDRTPQITDSFGRESARAIIIGAALVPNGKYDLSW